MQSCLRNSAAQIIGEMLSVHGGHKPCEVYAIRLIDEMDAFRMEMTGQYRQCIAGFVNTFSKVR